MAISINITKHPREILLSKYSGCHELKFGGKERNSQTSPRICRGNKDRITQSNLHRDLQTIL